MSILYIPEARFEGANTEHLTPINKANSDNKLAWISVKLADLYIKHVDNNVVYRLYNHVINGEEDKELLPYIEKDNYGITIFTLGKLGVIPTDSKYEILIFTGGKNSSTYLTVRSKSYYIKSILTNYDSRNLLDKFIYPELKKVSLTPDELITATTGFVYTLEERFSKNSPLPKEITLKTKSGKSILIHNHVAGSVSKVLYKVIYGPFNGDKIINLQCQDQTLDWFVEGAYTGVFKFDNTLTDHIDGANLLDYFEVLTKENLYQLLHAELFD